MRKRNTGGRRGVAGLAGVVALWLGALMLPGCGAISIEPVCPNSLRVGESGPLVSNVQNPGALAEFLWEAFPEGVVEFDAPTAANTRFTPLEEGDVVIRLTASDGLFQVISECVTTVEGYVGVSVALSAEPDLAIVGEEVLLTCADNGESEVGIFAITQTAGAEVTFNNNNDGTATFIAQEIGDVTFRCIGEAADGAQSDPVFLTVEVHQTEPPDDSNGNDNGDGTDNGNHNTNNNGGIPPRGGGRRVR